jgi:preprotein translocase subunit SecE
MADETTTTFGNVKESAGNWFERTRLFLSEVRNELKRVTWPSNKEVYATTVVVILVSIFFGVYLWILDLGLDKAAFWIYAKFGAA